MIRLRQSSRRPGMAGGGEAVFLCLCMAPTLRRITGTFNTPSRGCCDGSRDRQDLLAYYAKDGPAHREVSRWAGKGTEALGLSGSVDPDTFRQILEGRVPDEPQLGRRAKGGEIQHRPGRDVAFSRPEVGLAPDDGRCSGLRSSALGREIIAISGSHYLRL